MYTSHHRPYYRSHYRHRDHYYYDHYRRYDDLLLYELIRERDRDRERLRDKLYEVDACNPYYGDMLCRYKR